MAQLKSSIVTGSLRVTDAVLTDTVQTSTVKAPTTSGGTTYGAGTSGQVLKTNGTTAYWGDDTSVSPSSTTPLMDGTAAVGTGTTYARADHRHPTDTSRAPLASPALTGTPTAPTATAGTNTTQIATTAFVTTAVANKAVPEATSTTPKMDGTAAVGSETAFARGDHVHPTDTSRAASSHSHGNITNAGAITATGVALANGDSLAFVDSSDSSKIKKTSITFDGSTATQALTKKGTFETFLTQHQDLSAYAPLASPALTGTPTAPTAASGTNTTQIATTAFVKAAVDAKTVPVATTTTPKMDGTAAVGSETKWAKGDHVHPTDTSRAPLASPALTGTPTAPTANYETNSTQIATTAYVDTARKSASIEYIVGTQTASTNAWTGNTVDSELYTGKTIAYKLPFAGTSSAATLNLTLADGETTTGAKNVYLNNNTGVTTHFPVNTVIVLVYDGTYWRTFDYNTNDNYLAYRIRRGNGTYKAVTALYRYQFLLTYSETQLLPINAVNNSTATSKTLTTEPFDPFGEIYYYPTTTTVSAGANIGVSNLYTQYEAADLRYSFNTGSTLTAHNPIYIVAVPQSNGKAVLHTAPISQDLPTTEDGLIYICIGRAYDTYRIEIDQNKPVYYYKDSAIRLWTNPAASPQQQADWNETNTSSVSYIKNKPTIPEGASASSTTPKMDGTATVGTETTFARGDHVHPTDTSRAASSHAHGNVTNAGAITATGVAIANNDTLVIVDASDSSKLKQTSIKFDGSTTTTALTPKGTWESFAKTTDNITGTAANVTGTVAVDHGGTGATDAATARTNLGITPANIGAAASSHAHGNITSAGAITATGVALANGDTLAFVDSSDSSKIKKTSVSFDGSTATKALTQKGTFETFITSHQDISGLAPKASPALTGTPTAPTAAAGTSNTQIATTAFVDTAIDNVAGTIVSVSIPAASWSNKTATVTCAGVTTTSNIIVTSDPSTMEAATEAGVYCSAQGTNSLTFSCMGDEPSVSLTMDVWIGNYIIDSITYAPLSSPAFTGTPTAPTATTGTSTTQIATTAFVANSLSAYALKASPTFTGTPKAPTAATGDSSTQIATTAFVANAISQIPTGGSTLIKVNFGTISSLPQTVSGSSITSDMEVINAVLGTPTAQDGDWTVTTANGSVTVSGTIIGTTTLVIYLSDVETA